MQKDYLEKPVHWVNDSQGKTPNYDIYKIIPLRFFLKWVESKKIRFDQIAKWYSTPQSQTSAPMLRRQ